MVFLMVVLVTMSVIQSNFAEACFHELSTNSIPRHINYTGDVCRWTIIAPESQRIFLTLQRFDVENPDTACTVYLNIYDEESAARPVCPKFDGMNEYVSDGNTVHLNVTNISGRPVMTSLEATFRGAEEYFSCSFNTVADCTGQIVERSSWIYSSTGNDVCAGLAAVQGPRSGIFYQTPSSSATLRLPLLSPGKYVFDAEIIAACSIRDFRQDFVLTFCNITRSYSLEDYYLNWSTFFDIINCTNEFEVTIHISTGSMVVAIDNIKLMKVIDEIYRESTVPTLTTNSLVTFYHTEPSGFQQKEIMICVCSAIIFLVIVISVGCILVHKRAHRVNELSETQIKVTFDNGAYDNSNAQVPAIAMSQQYDAVGNNEYSMVSESEYQAVNGTAVTGDYHYIPDVTNLGYEMMVSGVQGQELNHAVNTQISENSTKLKVEDETYYMSTGNDYQDMSRPVSS